MDLESGRNGPRARFYFREGFFITAFSFRKEFDETHTGRAARHRHRRRRHVRGFAPQPGRDQPARRPRDPSKSSPTRIGARRASSASAEVTEDAFALVRKPEIDIVVELIGGTKIAKELILAAIENGKHVVTANKALLARMATKSSSRRRRKA